MEPTNDEIRKVLAEFMGYSDIREVEIREIEAFPFTELWGYNPATPGTMTIPDYTHDLNACHEVEILLKQQNLTVRYCRALEAVTGRDSWANEDSVTWAQLFATYHATASERARAAYSVIKAQKEAGND